MKYKTVLKVFVIAFLLFLLTVTLGVKFNWVKYLKEKPEVQGQGLTESQEVLGETGTDASTTKKKSTAVQFEIVSDRQVKVSDARTEQQVKNDCIRASRRAGVGDSEIHAVVRECVELSLQERNNPATSAPSTPTTSDSPNSNSNTSSVDSNLSLTRDACESVVAEQQGLNAIEKERLIDQCVKENTQ